MRGTVNSPTRLSLLLMVCALGCSTERDLSAANGWDRPYAGALADTRSRTVTSRITGQTYEISVALPRGYETSEYRYPVLYAVDANGEFGTVVEAARLLSSDQLVPELLIVGIGYPVGQFIDASAPRAVDLTPTADRDWERIHAAALPDRPAPEGSGGAAGFLRFLRQERIPRHYHV